MRSDIREKDNRTSADQENYLQASVDALRREREQLKERIEFLEKQIAELNAIRDWNTQNGKP